MVGHKPERFSFHQMAARTAGVLLWFCSIYVCLLDIRNKRIKVVHVDFRTWPFLTLESVNYVFI